MLEGRKNTVEVNCKVGVVTLGTSELPSSDLHVARRLEQGSLG